MKLSSRVQSVQMCPREQEQPKQHLDIVMLLIFISHDLFRHQIYSVRSNHLYLHSALYCTDYFKAV